MTAAISLHCPVISNGNAGEIFLIRIYHPFVFQLSTFTFQLKNSFLQYNQL